jgi:hypothetical protein
MYIRTVCEEASGIRQGILRKTGTLERIPKRQFWRRKFHLQQEPSFAILEIKRLEVATSIQQIAYMKMVATRDLAAKSGLVMKELEAEGILVVTKDGKPRSILLPTSDETLIEDLRDCLYARASRLLGKAQLESLAKGLDALSTDDIDKEIRATRRSRKR